ncbi:hypothetical protein H5410_055780 [Solanum commersonii]|uniref:Uncharacterized protein n=1 Tax=Solanum commersonii TaxID=4109 RepID=A0A9J5WL83_SOLCO|nr:hypothetical protein H5410_055780 [Solanum commersonii]
MGILGIGKGGRDERASRGAKARTSEQSKSRQYDEKLSPDCLSDRLINISLCDSRSVLNTFDKERVPTKTPSSQMLTWMFHRH